jgi:invasion protein IalB
MHDRNASARPLGRALTGTLAAGLLLAGASSVLAQTSAPNAQRKPPAAAPAKPATPAPAQAPAAAPGAPAAPDQQAGGQQPQLIYTPWTKLCQKGAETQNKQVCVVNAQARLETGQPVVMVQVVDPEGAERVLRVVLMIPVRVGSGTRLLLDQQELARGAFSLCAPYMGCNSDYKVDDALVAKLKKGKAIDVQAVNVFNEIVNLPLPLTDFASAYDGPPLDPKAFEEQQKKLQDELQKKAEEARKKMEGGAPSAAATPAPAPAAAAPAAGQKK